MRQDPIVIVTYDRDWPILFRSQSSILEALIDPQLTNPIEHIGSTSIPGMPAKPIVDMLAVVIDYEEFEQVIPAVERANWMRAPEPGDHEGRRWSLFFRTVDHRSHHLHVVEEQSTSWRDWLLFRDYLRTHTADAERYATLKRQLADADDHNRTLYRSRKAPMIKDILDRATAGSATRVPPHSQSTATAKRSSQSYRRESGSPWLRDLEVGLPRRRPNRR